MHKTHRQPWHRVMISPSSLQSMRHNLKKLAQIPWLYNCPNRPMTMQ